jgi:siroheme synthase (precorrin-2 oxidase/ferrochelatase)
MRVYYPVSLNLVARRCVVVGDANDREAIEKEAALREAGADVARISPDRLRDEDVVSAFFVISTPQDAVLSARLRKLADAHRFLLCCIDQPAFGFVAMAAIVKAGPVRVAISTAGLAPRVGKLLKEALQRAMDGRFARFIERVATRREATMAAHPGPENLSVRRKDALDAAGGFTASVTFEYPDWFEDVANS